MTKYAPALVILSAVGWGVATTGRKYALDGVGPITLLFLSLCAAAIFLSVAVLIRSWRASSSRTPTRPPLKALAVLGVLEPTLDNAALIVGLMFTSATNGSILQSTETIFTVILAFFFLKERLTRLSVVGLVAACIGVLLVTGGGVGVGVSLGDVILIIGMLIGAAYNVSAVRVAPHVDALTMTTGQFLFGVLFSAPFAISVWASGYEPLPTHAAFKYWGMAVGIGVCTALAFVLFNRGVRDVSASFAGMSTNVIAVTGVATAVIFLGESLTLGHIVGTAFIALGTFLFSHKKDQSEESDTEKQASEALPSQRASPESVTAET